MLTVTPMERAVPATWRLAASRSLALRSGIFFAAISATWSSVIEPADSRPASLLPFSRPAASRMRTVVGGVLRTKVNERSS